jgi:hypothetical protein
MLQNPQKMRERRESLSKHNIYYHGGEESKQEQERNKREEGKGREKLSKQAKLLASCMK